MDKEIEIKIQNNYEVWSILSAVTLFVVFVILSLVIRYFSVLRLLFLLLLCGICVFFFILAVRPTVVWSDGECLYWKHSFRSHCLKISDIADMKCEPYTVRHRYGSFYRINLTLRIKDNDIGEIEFNDSVKTDDLLNEKLGNGAAEVPVIQLYDYLKARICK